MGHPALLCCGELESMHHAVAPGKKRMAAIEFGIPDGVPLGLQGVSHVARGWGARNLANSFQLSVFSCELSRFLACGSE